MTSYIYRGVKYTQSDKFAGVNHQNIFMYRGVAYTKQKPVLATLDKRKICYRGSRLVGVVAPEPNRSFSIWRLFGDYKLAN